MRVLFSKALLASAIFFQLVLSSGADAYESKNGLPSIWSAIGANKQYRIMFQVQMLNSSERLTVEEWASFGDELHRLDLIADGGRTSYLTNGKTGEIFMYRPYRCALLSDGASELETLARLLRGFPLAAKAQDSGKPTVAYGLGPLWLSAKANAAGVEQLRPVRNFSVYEVELKGSSDDLPGKLRFFFRRGSKFVDSVEWISGAADSDRVLVQLRFKLTQMPGDEPIASEIFDIPVGHGCVRAPTYEHPFQVRHGLEFLHEGAPNEARLELSLSYPREASQHWRTDRYSLSLMRGSMKLNGLVRSYYVSQVQFREPASGQLSRRRRVWSEADGQEASAVLYSMNPEAGGDCRVGHVPAAERLRLELPRAREQPAPPIQISLDLLDWLFNSWDKFHLIDEKPSVLSLILREATYELRLEQLRLKESAAPIWQGPVSVVKQVSLMGQYVTYPFDVNQIKLFESYHTKVSLFFYSDDLAQLNYKISLDLFESTNIDLRHLQRQLDVSGCIPEQRSQRVTIEYPIEDEETRGSLVAMQGVLAELFCMNLFGSTPIDPLSVAGLETSVGQFDLRLSFRLLDLPLWQSFQMKAGLGLGWGAALHEKSSGSLESCAESCEHHNCLRFAFNRATRRCQLELGHEQSLAERKVGKDCALFVAPAVKMRSPWVEFDPNEGKKQLRPHELLEILQQFVLFALETDGGSETSKQEVIPLTITIDRSMLTGDSAAPASIALRPIAIHSSSLDDMNEIVRITAPTANGSHSNEPGELVFVRDRSRLRADYRILLQERDLAKVDGQTGSEQFGESSYDECAANCDDFNCRSFSYCEASRKCVVSRMHDGAELEQNSKHSFTCSISVLDYLTKFEAFGPAPLPARAKKLLEGRTEGDCAHFCVEDKSVSCQAFYFCQPAPGGLASKCFLEEQHIHDINPLGVDSMVAYQHVTGAVGQLGRRDSRACSFYSRSYLAQFDQLLGKSFDSAQSTGQHLEAEAELGPDACARDCIERSCVAFDVCLDEVERKPNEFARRSQVCRLSRGSIKKSDLTNKRKGCSTFVLSDRSQFRSANTTILDLGADFKALAAAARGAQAGEVVVDANQKDAEDGDIMAGLMKILSGVPCVTSVGEEKSIVGGSHWLSRLLSVLFGSFLGVAFAILWTKKETQLKEQFECRQLGVIFAR